MSASLPDEPDYTAETPRADVATDMQEVMDKAKEKFINGRIRKPEHERVRIKWLRAFVSASTEYRQLVSDIEAKEQEERIERLEDLVKDLT